jgi:hypothetical protein
VWTLARISHTANSSGRRIGASVLKRRGAVALNAQLVIWL